ncbi:MAG: hypothetical protein HOG79_04025, partial [Prolixibacteraceae bacterium]|nr:hypothetical protein [Prolixibacteraceae bacterium]
SALTIINFEIAMQHFKVQLVLLVIGIYFYTEKLGSPKNGQQSEQIISPDENECFISVNASRGSEFSVKSEICNIHISCGRFKVEEEAKAGSSEIKTIILFDEIKLVPLGERKIIKGENDWHVEQFFKTKMLDKGHRLKLKGQLMINRMLLLILQFFIYNVNKVSFF